MSNRLWRIEGSKLIVNLHPGQSEAWEAVARFILLLAGTGGGKTAFGPIWLYREVQKYPEDEFLVIAPTYKMLQRAILPKFMEFFDEALRLGEYKKADALYQLKTGGVVYFGSADKWENLEGPHVRGCWLDEPGRVKFEVWQVAQRRTGIYQAPILLSTTPYNLGWLKTEFYDRWKAGDADYFVSQFPSILNPSYPKEEFERARRTMPPWRFKMFYEGRFERPAGLIHPQYEIVEPFPIPKEWGRYVGLDWGFNNPTAAVWLAQEPGGGLYVYREYYQRGQTFDQIARGLHGLTRDEDILLWIGDPSGAQYIAELKRLMIPVRPAEKDGQEKEWVKAGIVKVDEMFRSGRLKIFSSCKHLLDEAAGWQWVMVENMATDKPGDEPHHLLDALRYVVTTLAKRAAPASIEVEVDAGAYETEGTKTKWV